MNERTNLCSPPNLAHLRRLTTEHGIWQHTKGDVPDAAMGYSIDDVARALIVVNRAAKQFPALNAPAGDDPRTLTDLANVYLSFLERYQQKNGWFHNFVSSDGAAMDDGGSEDSFGRTVWALGDTMAHGIAPEHRARAEKLFRAAEPNIEVSPFPRTNAFLLLGILEAVTVQDASSLRRQAGELIADLVKKFEEHHEGDWLWFEDTLRYSNGALPLALFRAGRVFADSDEELAADAVATAMQALDFLLKQLQHDGVPAPIGNKGWYARGKKKPLYDQQPVDAAAMVIASLEGWATTEDEQYQKAAEEWLRWYEGNNVLKRPLIEDDGSVHDGIHEGWVNQNRGAESVLAYLLARLRWAELCCS